MRPNSIKSQPSSERIAIQCAVCGSVFYNLIDFDNHFARGCRRVESR
jgi:hypothetical protein